MTATQAELLARARLLRRQCQSAMTSEEADRMFARARQSEREAAAAEARRAALREAEIVCGHETWAGFRIRALASPAPQEETR